MINLAAFRSLGLLLLAGLWFAFYLREKRWWMILPALLGVPVGVACAVLG
jgi:hypothetical protein